MSNREFSARLKGLRMSPRKVRLVAGLIRGKSALEAERILKHCPRRASGPLFTLLKSAMANASNLDAEIEASALRVHTVLVDEGGVLKRFRPRAMGRASSIHKRISRVKIVLEAR